MRTQLIRQGIRAHAIVYRLTGGLVGSRLPDGTHVLLLDHVGAKSGKRRSTPLVYIRDGDSMVVVASKAGAARNPGWFHNLRANPETQVQAGSGRIPVTARVASPSERERLWPQVVDTYAGYADYQKRTERQIPLVILEPRAH
jgi:deazaflavin-dependent oxidoreductase (nitroreductase family)